MKLEIECIRDLLIAIENSPSMTAWIPIESLSDELLEKYTLDTLNYTALILAEAKLIKAEVTFEGGAVQRLTLKGHEMLDNVRDKKVWRMAKEQASNLASISLANLVELANLSARKLIGLD